MQKVIEISNGITRHPLYRMKGALNLEFVDGEQIAIVGRNGSGKSMLVDILTGAHPLLGDVLKYDFSPSLSSLAYDNIKYITFRDSYGEADNTYYYQQRWNQHDITESSTKVGTLLEETYNHTIETIQSNAANNNLSSIKIIEQIDKQDKLKEKLYSIFQIEDLLDKYVILLSSGELRKFQITKTLLSNPRIVIMDNPFIGLDESTRIQLKEVLNELSTLDSIEIILVLSKTDDIPDFITHVIPVENMDVCKKISKDEYLSQKTTLLDHVISMQAINSIASLPYKNQNFQSKHVIDFNNVSIKYGSRTILNNINWSVKRGEKWALSGENGAGKSTLLSLVCADNPQSYACDITLFDKKRGTGESIWDIKKHIGYVSPEMHRAYLKDLPAIEIVASGLNDSVGLYKKAKPEQQFICEWWMNIFGIGHLKDKTFLKISSGEQRLCLLARAFVKDPELLILDEPLHGLDDYNRTLVIDIIEAFCNRIDKTMIMVTHYKEELPACITNYLLLKKSF